MEPLLELGRTHGLAVLEDACQAHGALHRGPPGGDARRRAGNRRALLLPDEEPGRARRRRGGARERSRRSRRACAQLRNGGQTSRYRHESFGVNSRLDELQAAILRVGLRHLAAWTERRRALAALYLRELADTGLGLPREQPYARAVYHLFVVRHPRRDAFAEALAERGVGTLVHYPMPLHLQPAFADPAGPPRLPVAEQACAEILSLPLYPELSDEQARRVVAAVRDAAGRVRC